ncbi:MAG: hypothetical protein Q8O67_24320 [Deltaproteobacteria bacterium]|nr:hypothetical protein [Deltaproteobacteria bacterium]
MTTTRAGSRGPSAVELPALPAPWTLPAPKMTTAPTTTMAPELAAPLTEHERQRADLRRHALEMQEAWRALREHTPELRRELDVAVAVGFAAARRELDRWARDTVHERAFALLGVALAVGLIAGLRPAR